jgi:hypothetical protein
MKDEMMYDIISTPLFDYFICVVRQLLGENCCAGPLRLMPSHRRPEAPHVILAHGWFFTY